MSRDLGLSVAVCLGASQIVGRERYALAPMEARAVKLALSLSDAPRALHVSCGAAREALRPYLGIGLSRIDCLATLSEAEEGDDPAAVLAHYFKGAMPDVILTGMQAATPLGMGLVPFELAHHLGIPIVANVAEMSRDGDGIIVQQVQDWGKRKSIRLTVPFVATVGFSGPEPRGYSHRAACQGKIIEAARVEQAGPQLSDARVISGRRKQPLEEDVARRLARVHGEILADRGRRHVCPDTAASGATELRAALLEAGLWPAVNEQ